MRATADCQNDDGASLLGIHAIQDFGHEKRWPRGMLASASKRSDASPIYAPQEGVGLLKATDRKCDSIVRLEQPSSYNRLKPSWKSMRIAVSQMDGQAILGWGVAGIR